jgi:Flp pilus assembly protein TadD
MQGKNAQALETLAPAAPSTERDALVAAAETAERNWPAAVEAFNRALREGPATPELLNGLGWAHYKLGQNDMARAAFERSLGQKPDQPEIRKLVTSLRRSSDATR